MAFPIVYTGEVGLKACTPGTPEEAVMHPKQPDHTAQVEESQPYRLSCRAARASNAGQHCQT